MLVDKKYNPGKCVSTDGTRYELGFIHANPEIGYIEATDARRAVFVPAEFDAEDRPAPIDADYYARARQFTRKGALVHVRLRARRIVAELGEWGLTWIVNKLNKVDGFPKCAAVIKQPRAGENQVIVSLDPRLLLGLADAMGAKKGVTLIISLSDNAAQESFEPIMVYPDDIEDAYRLFCSGSIEPKSAGNNRTAFGIIMPRRRK